MLSYQTSAGTGVTPPQLKDKDTNTCYLAGGGGERSGDRREWSNGEMVISRANTKKNSTKTLLQCHSVYQEAQMISAWD
jgi:hypothetical protein